MSRLFYHCDVGPRNVVRSLFLVCIGVCLTAFATHLHIVLNVSTHLIVVGVASVFGAYILFFMCVYVDCARMSALNGERIPFGEGGHMHQRALYTYIMFVFFLSFSFLYSLTYLCAS